eukprot:3483115-Amphidinium_carterae.1
MKDWSLQVFALQTLLEHSKSAVRSTLFSRATRHCGVTPQSRRVMVPEKCECANKLVGFGELPRSMPVNLRQE